MVEDSVKKFLKEGWGYTKVAGSEIGEGLGPAIGTIRWLGRTFMEQSGIKAVLKARAEAYNQLKLYNLMDKVRRNPMAYSLINYAAMVYSFFYAPPPRFIT